MKTECGHTHQSLAFDARRAAEAIIDAFANNDRQRYFDAFAHNATFLFYNEPHRLASRAEYESLWLTWEEDGFRVLACASENATVDIISETVAIFTHTVHTTLSGADQETHERETIVLRRDADGRWLGVHEHLSPVPQSS
jgi:ketosteroid isomerase-like protein